MRHSRTCQHNCILLTCVLSAMLATVLVLDGMALQQSSTLSTRAMGAAKQLADLLSSESLRYEVPSAEFICISEKGVCWTCSDLAKRPVKHPVKRLPVEVVSLPSAPYTQCRQNAYTARLLFWCTKVLSNCTYGRWT